MMLNFNVMYILYMLGHLSRPAFKEKPLENAASNAT